VYPSSERGPTPAIPDLPPINPDDPVDRYGEFVPPPLPPPHGRLSVQVALFALTFLTTTVAGTMHYAGFAEAADPSASGSADIIRALSSPAYYLNGLWYSLTILAILGCHEMGHYILCLRYGVTATRPYFLPVPPIPFLTGTLGAFIRIKARIPDKVALFDIGVAGPIAGFVVAMPLLALGLMLSRVQKLTADPEGLMLGEPLVFRLVAWLIFGDVASSTDYSISLHPMAFAAWFGLLATALNLFPISQLDGGHIAYAVFGRRSTIITFATIALAIGLTFVSSNWIVWTALMLTMILVVGPHHPPTLDDDIRLGPGRLLVAAIALAMLIVCFTPAPISEFVAAP
jgi:membrane-associated protease RseP (regulator of RpoE activity)